MHNITRTPKTLILLTMISVLGFAMLVGCSPSTNTDNSDNSANNRDSEESSGTTADSTQPVAISSDGINLYCGNCHMPTAGNAEIASFNKTNIDAAMVESMIPSMDDATIQGIVEYYSHIEASEE